MAKQITDAERAAAEATAKEAEAKAAAEAAAKEAEAKPKLVKLKDKGGGFTDPETGFDLSRDQEKALDEIVGKRTRAAIAAGAIVLVD